MDGLFNLWGPTAKADYINFPCILIDFFLFYSNIANKAIGGEKESATVQKDCFETGHLTNVKSEKDVSRKCTGSKSKIFKNNQIKIG